MTKPPKSLVRRPTWPTSVSRPVVTPLQPSVVYASPDPDGLDQQYEQGSGFTYAREGHPNLPKFGVETSLADPTDAGAIEAALKPNTRMIIVEVVSNPTIRIADMKGIAALAKERGILLVVDNTFTTPRGYQPFDHGADIVIHSVTKLLAGHSDATLGYAVAKDPELMEKINTANVTWGLTPSPFDCWLAERGLQTFDLRYDRAEATATALSAALVAAANALTNAASDLPFAPTLGDVGTTLSHPASSSHRALTEEGRAALGISEGFFRVSVGLEDPDLLIAELSEAIAQSQKN